MLSQAEIRVKAQSWLGQEFNEETRKEVREMLDKDEKKLIDAFYQDLEFGTGGLRGIMGAGTNRMNIYTLGMATQGLSNYIRQQCGNSRVKVAIAYVAETTADTLQKQLLTFSLPMVLKFIFLNHCVRLRNFHLL